VSRHEHLLKSRHGELKEEMMTNQPPYDPNNPALRAAINEAESLVQRMHGGNV
jgi:hypothetical protein